jgi:hypothetical protein
MVAPKGPRYTRQENLVREDLVFWIPGIAPGASNERRFN